MEWNAVVHPKLSVPVLPPPGAPAPSTATAPVKRDLAPAKPVVVPKPPYNR